MNWSALFLLFFIVCVNICEGQTIYLDPTDEKGINDALKTADGGTEKTTVVLNAGVYEIDSPIIIYSNTHLIGEGATILVSEDSRQWFTPGNEIIHNTAPVENVVIENLTIDGNCHNLPAKYANSPGHKHDCEKLIRIKGYSSRYSENISIRNCKFANAFSDAVYIQYSKNVIVEGNMISNCQHSSIYFSCVIDGLVQENDIAGITSDDVRIENCKNIKVLFNLLHGYFGTKSNGAYQGGHNLIQVGDQGYSYGYGSPKPIHTENIEIANNTFSGRHRNSIWIDAAGKKPTTNLWIHDNEFVDMPEIEKDGYSASNPPTIEESEEVFSEIKSAIHWNYIFQYLKHEYDFDATADVVYHNYTDEPYALVSVDCEDAVKVVRLSYNGKSARHFIEKDMWIGEYKKFGDSWYIPGVFDVEKLKITVYSENGFETLPAEDIEVREAKIGLAGVNPDLFTFIPVITVSGITIARNIRRVFNAI